MAVATGRERQWDIELDGTPYRVARDKNGMPAWRSTPVPAIAGQSVEISEEERQSLSWHGGFGWSHFLVPSTYYYAIGIDLSRPRQAILGPLVTTFAALATVTGFVEIGSSLFAIAGRYLQKVDVTNDACKTPDNVDYTLGFDAGVSTTLNSVIPWDSASLCLFDTATDAYKYDGALAPTQLTTQHIQGVYAARFWSQNANAYVLARSYTAGGDPAVAWIAQGVALDSTSWTAAYDVGDDTKPITGLAGGPEMLWVAKKDGLYYIDGRSGRTPRVVEASPVDDNNGVGLFVDSAGRVWYPSAGGLYRYNPATGEVDDVTPGRGLGNASPIYGDRWSLAQYKGWYYCTLYNGTDSYLMVGREREAGEPGIGPLVWHGALAKATGARMRGLHVTGQTSPPRLYWGQGSMVGYIRLPDKADNPLQSTTYRYAASGSLYTPADNIGTAGMRWALMGLIVEGEGLNTATYCDVYAQLDHGNWQSVGRVQGSGRAFVPVPSGSDWRFSNIALRFDFVNASSASTPKVRAIVVRAARRVATRDLLTTTLHCSERARSELGITTRRAGDDLLSAVKALATQGPVNLTDWWTGNQRSRRVLVQPAREVLVREHGWDEAEVAAEVSLTLLSSETVVIDQAPIAPSWDNFNWNDGSLWG